MEAAALHRLLESAVLEHRAAERRAVSLFAEVLSSRAYRELGYANIYDYAAESFGFSRSKTSHWIALSKAMRSMPALRRAVNTRELEWSKAVEVARVATPQSAKQWVEVAKHSNRKQLRERIRSARAPSDRQTPLLSTPSPPSAPAVVQPLRLQLSATQRARYERAMGRLREQGSQESELVIQALESFTGESPKGVTLLLLQCPRCNRTDVELTQGSVSIPREEAERLRCEATIQTNGGRRKRVPPKLRRQVLERDRHRCTHCKSAQRLEVHHLHEQSQGGTHMLENLTTLCSACHRMMHRALHVP